MEWNAFLNEYGEKYGLSSDDYGPLKKCAVITFNRDEKENISGMYRNLIVYRDMYSGNTILPGETWICSLSLNPNTEKKNYFAKPIEKIDASFLFALLADDRKEIIEAIWKNHGDTIFPQLEEKFKDTINERVKDAEQKISAERESIIAELNDKNAALEKKNAEDREIIDSLQLQIEGLKARTSEIKQEIIQEKNTEQQIEQYQNMTLFQEPKVTVKRIGPDTISSDYFIKSRYFVHLSADQRIMVVRPSDNGNVVCVNNTIVLGGLSNVSDYSEPCEMMSQYNPRFGGVQIYL